MKLRAFYESMHGNWTGTYRLWLDPDSDAAESRTTGEVRPAAGGKYALFSYTWEHGGDGHAGVFLLGGAREEATATWGDSFHMAPEPMICQGVLADNGQRLIFNGQYPAGDEHWGWRTEFIHENANTLAMKAFNITPDGQEMLAVLAEMERS